MGVCRRWALTLAEALAERLRSGAKGAGGLAAALATVLEWRLGVWVSAGTVTPAEDAVLLPPIQALAGNAQPTVTSAAHVAHQAWLRDTTVRLPGACICVYLCGGEDGAG